MAEEEIAAISACPLIGEYPLSNELRLAAPVNLGNPNVAVIADDGYGSLANASVTVGKAESLPVTGFRCDLAAFLSLVDHQNS